MDGYRRGWWGGLAVALAAAALSGCNRERLRQAGLIDDNPHGTEAFTHGTGPCPAPPPPPHRVEPPPEPVCHDPCLPPQRSLPCGPACTAPALYDPCGPIGVAEYVPVVPAADTRAAITTLILAPSPWIGTEGDPTTPERGRATFRWERISDERDLADESGNVWSSDGELQAINLEYVSPKIVVSSRCANPFCFHLAASIHAYTLTTALFDDLRNFVEEQIVGSDEAVKAMHDIGGRELSLNGDDLLESTLWKVKGVAKFTLPDLPVEGTRFQGSLSIGVTSPAFGSDHKSGNSSVQVDTALAFALPLSAHFRFVGGVAVLFPGASEAYDDVDLEHEGAVPSARLGLEWWVSRHFAAMAGVSWYGHYTRDSGLPTDDSSAYLDFGFLWRIDDHWDVHLFGSENPQNEIQTAPGADFSQSQRDADFTIGLGVGWTF